MNSPIMMKILYVTNMYPSKERVYDGIFIKEQIEFYEKKYTIKYNLFVIDGVKSKINYLRSIVNVNRLLIKEKSDLIHIHFGLSGIFVLFNPFIKIPIVVTFHGSDIQSYKKSGLIQVISKLVARRANKIIILNDNMFNILKKDQRKLIKIPCGIDIQKFNTERKNINNDKFLIGFPSDVSRPVKNYKLFKSIIGYLNKNGYQVESFEFKNLTRGEVVDNLSRLDCLLMTSLSEGSPQIIKEAMACGVPIVSSNVGDVAILLSGVSNCFVVNSFDPLKFINEIIKLINLKPSERVTNGKEKIKLLGLDQSSVCSKLFELYQTIMREQAHIQ